MNRKIFLTAITICTVLATVVNAAVPESPEAALRRENARLRDELLRRSKELEDIKLYLANITSGGIQKSSEREKNALATLDKLSRNGMTMAMTVDSKLRELRAMLRVIPLSELQRAQINLRLEAMETAVRRFIIFAGEKQKDSCHVVAVERPLGIVVISGGLNQGIFPGMVFRPEPGNSPIRLRVIAVRPELAAAELISGAWEELTPGMSVTAFFRSGR